MPRGPRRLFRNPTGASPAGAGSGLKMSPGTRTCQRRRQHCRCDGYVLDFSCSSSISYIEVIVVLVLPAGLPERVRTLDGPLEPVAIVAADGRRPAVGLAGVAPDRGPCQSGSCQSSPRQGGFCQGGYGQSGPPRRPSATIVGRVFGGGAERSPCPRSRPDRPGEDPRATTVRLRVDHSAAAAAGRTSWIDSKPSNCGWPR